jgi:tol-pal system protein YbgF
VTTGNSTLVDGASSTSAAIEPAISGSFLANSRGNSAANSSLANSGRATLEPAVLSEQQLYQMAYDSVINSNFERSLAEFDQYLSIYTQGRFVTNAYYWKGQAYLYLNRFDEARESYEIILNQYADSPKLPDAMYGLGLAYQGLGNIPQAKQLLNDIRRRFPNTGVANLADTRLLLLD